MARAYVLVKLQPGKEKEFRNEVAGITSTWKGERFDVVHGPYDVVIILEGEVGYIDRKVMEIRKSPYVLQTETLLRFEIFDWEDLASRRPSLDGA